MEYRQTSVYRARYADTVYYYDVTGISGMTDDEVQNKIKYDFRIRGYFCDNELRSYERLSDDSAKIVIVSPFLD